MSLEEFEDAPIEDAPLLEDQPVVEDQPLEDRPEPEDVPIMQDAFEQITHPDAQELPPPTARANESVIGKEQLTRVRARYAELQARITERGGDAARIEELRAQAEGLNPDSWVTDEDARKGIQEFDVKVRDLRAALGLRPRRRSRRGGRRRRRGGQGTAPAAAVPESAVAPITESPDTGKPDGEG